jgi:hypothetical protein
MDLSLDYKSSLFASLKTAYWPTFLSMSCEAALKSEKKTIKNQNFSIKG